MPNIENFSLLSAEELVQALSVGLYEPPLNRLRETLASQPEVLRVLTLVLDFDTEVSMSGILGYLENSTGRWLSETIEAFALIGARETADILRRVQAAMNRHGTTPATLRSDVDAGTLHGVVSFGELHGLKSEDMSREVTEIAGDLYVGDPDAQEEPWQLLYAYVEPRRLELLDALGLR
jgi:hypothetical protein